MVASQNSHLLLLAWQLLGNEKRSAQTFMWKTTLNQGKLTVPENTTSSTTIIITMPELIPERTTNANSETQTDSNGIQEGLGSLNRWSQSTVSSKDSPVNRSRGNSSPSNIESPKANASPASTSSPECYVLDHQRGQSQGFRVSQLSMSASHTEASRLGSSDAGTIPKLAANDTFDSNLETSEPVLASPALFQNPWAKSSSLSMGSGERNLSHDLASSQQVSDSSRPASAKGYGSGQRRRAYSQKAMLSKALQKANTAVLLDNAANFEGAMEAYNDACQLLQLVMLRSNGGEDERMKLQEIVSLPSLPCRTY